MILHESANDWHGNMKKPTYKKYSKKDQRTLAILAADCAEHVLALFEQAYPKDDRPRQAIETCRTWIQTGVFKMAEIRGASLAAHAAARDAKENDAACFAARSAGQAVATAHVPQHAYGALYYALKAVAAADPSNAESNISKERTWQSRHLAKHSREEFLKRIIVQKNGKRIAVKLQKGKGF